MRGPIRMFPLKTWQVCLGAGTLLVSLLTLGFGSGWWAATRNEWQATGHDAARLETLYTNFERRGLRIDEKERQIDAIERSVYTLASRVDDYQKHTASDITIIRDDIKDIRIDMREIRSMISTKMGRSANHMTTLAGCP